MGRDDGARVFDILNLGAGVQSSRIFLASCLGEIRKPDVAVFADTQWEPKGVYETLAFLEEEGRKAGIPVIRVSAGNIREDAIEFRRGRKSADGKRYASMPTFIKNPDGSTGRVKRQCTSEYKIRPIEQYIRREMLGLAKGKRVPRGVLVRQWLGISDDESSRCSFPGRHSTKRVVIGKDLGGDPIISSVRDWKPDKWRAHVYPLLNEVWMHDRSIEPMAFLSRREQRADCLEWLSKRFPGRAFPRSACIGCPFRSNSEWLDMRAARPVEWADACDFDESQRRPDAECISKRGLLVGESFVHRQLVPLRMADLGGVGEAGGGCGTLYDGLDGFCGL